MPRFYARNALSGYIPVRLISYCVDAHVRFPELPEQPPAWREPENPGDRAGRPLRLSDSVCLFERSLFRQKSECGGERQIPEENGLGAGEGGGLLSLSVQGLAARIGGAV